MSKLSAKILSLIDQEDDRKMMIMEDERAHLWRRIIYLENSLVEANNAIKKKREQLNSIISKYSSMRDKVIEGSISTSCNSSIKKRPNNEEDECYRKKDSIHDRNSREMQSILQMNKISHPKVNISNKIHEDIKLVNFPSPQKRKRSNESTIIENINNTSSNPITLNKPSTTSSTSTASYIRKCIEVVRNKAARASLPGHECDECKRFYSAMIEQGIFQPGEKLHMLKECSRHKARWTPPSTPEGFWELSLNTPSEWNRQEGEENKS